MGIGIGKREIIVLIIPLLSVIGLFGIIYYKADIWLETFKALLAPMIALLGVYIAWQQWRINRERLKHDMRIAEERLKHELFEKRYPLFESIRNFLAIICTHGIVAENEIVRFINETQGSRFIFDDEIAFYVENIRKNADELSCFENKLHDEYDKEKLANISKKREELFEWFRNELLSIEDRFLKYLHLMH